MGMRRRITTAAIAVLAGALPLLPSPATASATGEIVFECHAYMVPATGSGSCRDGLLPARAEVVVGGISSAGAAYLVEGIGPMSAAFEYSEGECLANLPSPLMTVRGTGTVTGLAGFKGGAQVTASVQAEFHATAVGNDVTIIITGLQITFSDGDTATLLVTASANGSGSFLPLPTTGTPCVGPWQALVQGEIDLAV